MIATLLSAAVLFSLALALLRFRDRLSSIAAILSCASGWIVLFEAWAMM